MNMSMMNIYICPNEKDLHYVTTSREGYRVYKSDSKDCEGCSFLLQCTKSKNHEKVITRHIWEEDISKAKRNERASICGCEGKSWHMIYTIKRDTKKSA